MKKIKEIIGILFLMSIFGCVMEDSGTVTYSDGTTSVQAADAVIVADAVVVAKPSGSILELENLYKHCGSRLYTKIYELDGYKYRIIWMGDASEEGGMVVINLEEQEARIKFYKSNSK